MTFLLSHSLYWFAFVRLFTPNAILIVYRYAVPPARLATVSTRLRVILLARVVNRIVSCSGSSRARVVNRIVSCCGGSRARVVNRIVSCSGGSRARVVNRIVSTCGGSRARAYRPQCTQLARSPSRGSFLLCADSVTRHRTCPRGGPTKAS
jgi:hypothetical protein